MAGNKLTRVEYELAIDRLFTRQKAELLARYDHGMEVYDGEPDLTSRDWIQEAYEERLDEIAYAIFDEVREERNL